MIILAPCGYDMAGPRLAEGAAVLAAFFHPDRAGHLLPPGAAEPVA